MALSLKRQKGEDLVPVFAARAPLPREIWDKPRIIQFIHLESPDDLGVDIEKGHLFLAHVAMELLTDEWFDNRKPWDENPELSATEQFCLVHGVYHAWQSDMEDWAMDMCLNVEKMYWWLCAARHEDGGLQRVVEDLTSQGRLPGIKLMASLVRLSTRAIARDPRQWAGQVLGRLEEKDLTRHAFMSGARHLLERQRIVAVLVPQDEISGLEPAGGAVVDVWHTPAINSVTYSPDGLQLASGSYDNMMRIWDAQTGRVLHVLEGHVHEVKSVAFSPDGLHLASGSWDRMVRIWDTITGKVLRTWEGHTEAIWSVAFSPDGLHLASGSFDGTVRIWDTLTNRCVRVLEDEHTRDITSVAYSPDGLKVASGSYDDDTVRIWDAQSGQVLKVLGGHTDGVNSVAFSPDGLRLASASADHMVRIWDTNSGETLSMLRGHTEGINSVAYSPDGLHLASASDDSTMRIWDTQTGLCVHVLEGHTDRVWSVAYSPHGHHLASASYDDDTMRIWDTLALDAVRHKKTKDIQGDDDVSSQYSILEDLSITSRHANMVSFTFDNRVHGVREGDFLDVAFSDYQGVSLKIV